jgi:hypothetical protein
MPPARQDHILQQLTAIKEVPFLSDPHHSDRFEMLFVESGSPAARSDVVDERDSSVDYFSSIDVARRQASVRCIDTLVFVVD